ncbi:hypothetical protein JCM10908_004558 [Rhodotorula pacifica]|uniref:DHHC family palmitoyltransferase n=1 Tax=Rhodotorula pacifica TaxID=1495444 RepID=UPI00316D5264
MLDCQLEKANNAHNKESTATATKPKRERVKLMGIRQHLEVQRVRQQEKQEPDNWFVRKFIIGIVAGVFGYSYYVYVVRLCVPMIRMQNNRLGGRAQGLAYLVIYHILFVMFIWTYLVAVATPPGFARDYVPETDPPQAEEEYITVAGQAFEDQLQPIRKPKPLAPADLYHAPNGRRARNGRSSSTLSLSEEDGIAAIGGDEEEEGAGDGIEMRETGTATRGVLAASRPTGDGDEADLIAETVPTAGAFGPAMGSVLAAAVSPPTRADTVEEGGSQPMPMKVARPAPVHVSDRPTVPTSNGHGDGNGLDELLFRSSSRTPSAVPSQQSYLHFPDPPPELEPPRPLAVERIPRNLPVLTEQYRYDPRERIVRPFRSHRCKHCAKVVLKMDHHCPWVGSCVGARNYKYFYNFLQWSSAYLFFVFLTLLIAQTLPLGTFTPPERPYPGVDGQQIAIIALSFFFLFFTGSLLIQHTGLILRNMTTIEQIGLARMKQRERAALASEYGFFGFKAKRNTRREWDKRWGRPDREGNLWWLGSSRANWEMVHGQAKLGWFLPIPAKPTMDDGLHYVPNPRFSPEGHWRERRFWPAELR